MRRTTKRKMYQKRRKKEKAEQRKKSGKQILPGATATATLSKNNQFKNKRNFCNSYPTNFSDPTSSITYSESLQIWWRTYCSAIEFHCQQQNAWKIGSQEQQFLLLEKYAEEYETSSEDEDDLDCNDVPVLLNSGKANVDALSREVEKEDLDEEYLKFLEVTHKHREQLRLKKGEENV